MRIARSEECILQLLVALGPTYGLDLVQASRGILKRGGIYVTLGRMEEKGLVRSSPGDAGRRIYSPTPLGERLLLAADFVAGRVRLDQKA